MIVLVTGSRDWRDYGPIYAALSALPSEPITLIHGGASRTVRGREVSADMLAHDAARRLGFEVRQFAADWERHGRRAGILRNLAMLDENPDIVIAFQRDGSRGTQHTIDEARRRGIPVEVHSA